MTQAVSQTQGPRDKAAEAIRLALIYFRRDALEADLPITAQAIELALDALAHDLTMGEPAAPVDNVFAFPTAR